MIVTIKVIHSPDMEFGWSGINWNLNLYVMSFFINFTLFFWAVFHDILDIFDISSRHKTFSSLKKHFSTSKWQGFQSTSLDWHLKFLRLKGTPIYGRRELLNVTLTIRCQPFNSDLLLPPISTFLLFIWQISFSQISLEIFFTFWTYRQIKPKPRK